MGNLLISISPEFGHPTSHRPDRPCPIASLPDLALKAIMERVPLRDLGAFARGCTRWYEVQRHVCRSRDKLVLIVGKPSERDLEALATAKRKAHLLYYKRLTWSTVHSLMSTFGRHVRRLHLWVYHTNPTALTKFAIQLAEQMAPRLVEFGLWTNFRHSRIQADYTPLVQLINMRMPALRRLVLFTQDAFEDSIEWPVLRQLSHCEFLPICSIGTVLDSLEKYTQNQASGLR